MKLIVDQLISIKLLLKFFSIGLDNCIENMASKTKYNVHNFEQSKKKKDHAKKINLKKEKLKTKIKPSFIKPVLSDADALAYLATLHRKYIIVSIDKASNNVFVCKKLCSSKILSEVGEHSNI